MWVCGYINGYFWLRSPGHDDDYAANVNNDGNVNGNNVNNDNIGVRPDLLSWPEMYSK
jgi:hypothetical protein